MKTFLIILSLFLFDNAYAAQVETRFIKDLAVTAAKMSSGASASGTVATSNGSGGVSYVATTITFSQEVPSGTVNSINTSFTLSNTPTTSAGVLLFIDGMVLRQGTDYTITGASITMTTAPVTSQTLYAFYRY